MYHPFYKENRRIKLDPINQSREGQFTQEEEDF